MTKIRVPKPAAGSFNKNRPVSDLLKWQMRHMHEVEMKLPYEHRTGTDHRTIKSEQEASAYIRKITEKLKSEVHLRRTIRVPRAAAGSLNKDRLMSQLLRNQVRHLREVEKRWPEKKQTGIDINSLRTEKDASEYIRKVTAVLHPDGARKKS